MSHCIKRRYHQHTTYCPVLFQSDIKVNIKSHTNTNIALKWIFEMGNFGNLTVHLNAILESKFSDFCLCLSFINNNYRTWSIF